MLIKNYIVSNISLDNQTINQAKTSKFLGLIIDECLNWNSHVDYLVNKINSGLFVLRSMAFICDISVLKMVYHSLIESHIRYGICIYGGTTQKNLKQILTLQKKAIRIIQNLKYNESAKPYFKEMGIFTVHGLYIFETIQHFCKEDQQDVGLVHNYNTRWKSTIVNKNHRLQLFKKETSYIGNYFLRNLPATIKSEKNNKANFIRKLKLYLLNLAPYSIEEFMAARMT